VHTLGTSLYGQIIPSDNSTYIGAPGAILSGQGDNAYAFTQTATGVTIEYLTIEDFAPPGGQGAVNHDSGAGWTLQYDTIEDNSPGAGLMIGSNNVVSDNCLTDNGEYGFNAYLANGNAVTGGPANITVTGNEISYNDLCNWEDDATDPVPAADIPANCANNSAGQFVGCGCSGGGKFWEVDGAVIEDNYIHNNYNIGLWADTNNTGLTIDNNYISDNWNEGVIYELGYNAQINDNAFVDNAWGGGPANPGFPTGAIYVSESGGDARVAGADSGEFQIENNIFTNNWAGVVLWENSNRFCGTGAGLNATGVCTLVEPTVANVNTCTQANLTGATPAGDPDYYDLCRWKTQNVTVSGNAFNFTEADVPACTGSAVSCGENAIFSEYGTYPTWSPYSGFAVSNAITTTQHNVFSDNTYDGSWSFMWHDQSQVLSFAEWQAEGQDAGSTS
jgi:hypothetical protein